MNGKILLKDEHENLAIESILKAISIIETENISSKSKPSMYFNLGLAYQ